MEVTKKEIEEFLIEIRKDYSFKRNIKEVCIYIHNGSIGKSIRCENQGTFSFLIYPEKFNVKICYLTDLLDKNKFNLNDATNIAYYRVQNMIEEYKNN